VLRLLHTATALAAVSLALVACGGGPVSLSSFFKLHVRNDTRRTVTLVLPVGSPERLAREQGIDIYARRKSQSGVILVRVVSGRKTVGCLKVHYRKGQDHRFVPVSAATPCSS
jgi:hypothetical protein